VSSVLRPHQHSIGYTGDGFYRSKDPTNSVKVLKEDLQTLIYWPVINIIIRTITTNDNAMTDNGNNPVKLRYNL